MNKKRNLIIILLVCILSILLASCSGSIYMETWKDTNYKGKFNIIMVEVITNNHSFDSDQDGSDTRDSVIIQTFENNVANALKHEGLAVIPASTLLHNSSYTDSTYTEILEENLIDGILTLEYKGTDVQKTINLGRPFGFPWGRRIFRKRRYLEVHRYLDFTCSLEKVETGKDIWKASAKINVQNNIKESASDFGEKLKDELTDEGLIY